MGLFDLFADPQHSITDQILRAYEHHDKWTNRMILGDSLVVMNSLVHYEGLGGQVQMIYMDPPYGVKFGSNFQPFIRKRDVSHNDDEDMTREPEMVQAYRHDAIDTFKAKYRTHCDVLMLEDIHFLSGKERTQVELASTLDTLSEAGKRIIFSSSYLPSDIPKLHDKLRSRFSSSLISAIDPPNFRTRMRILQKKAAFCGYQIPEAVISYLASELTDDVRQLESGLNGVAAKSSLLGVPIDASLAESVVKHIVSQRQKITVELIKKIVCKFYNVSPDEIVSSSRQQNLVRPRQMAIYLARRFTDSPLQAIGKTFNRYHATALHSIHSIEKGLKQDSAIRQQVDFFRQKLESGKL